jgi:hypothetical protein
VAVQRIDRVIAFLSSSDPVAAVGASYSDNDRMGFTFRSLGGAAVATPAEWLPHLRDHKVAPAKIQFFGLILDAWRSSIMDQLLEGVVLGAIGELVFMNPVTGDATCPYDGGIDTFVWSDERRLQLRDSLATWLWQPLNPEASVIDWDPDVSD